MLLLAGCETPAPSVSGPIGAPTSGTERVCQILLGPSYESRVRNTCRVGDIIVVEAGWDAANLCDLRKPNMSGNSNGGYNVCYLASPREAVTATSGAAQAAAFGAPPSARDQEAVKFAATGVFRDRLMECGTRSFAYTVVGFRPVLTELAKPVLGGELLRNPNTKADALNGLDYVGYVVLRADASRPWVEGKGWGDWVNGLRGEFPTFSVTHRNGKWEGSLNSSSAMSAWKETQLDCATILQLEGTVVSEQVMLDHGWRQQEAQERA